MILITMFVVKMVQIILPQNLSLGVLVWVDLTFCCCKKNLFWPKSEKKLVYIVEWQIKSNPQAQIQIVICQENEKNSGIFRPANQDTSKIKIEIKNQIYFIILRDKKDMIDKLTSEK